jgi:hypothetical protein
VWDVNSKHLLAVRVSRNLSFTAVSSGSENVALVSRSLRRIFLFWQTGTPNAYSSRQSAASEGTAQGY